MDKVIFSYSTKQAVNDGVLVEVEHAAYSEWGIKFPVFLTSRAWERYVAVPKGMEGFQDLKGRLGDMLLMFSMKAKRLSTDRMHFPFVCQLPADWEYLDNEDNCGDGQFLRGITLKSIIGPRDIDDPRPGIFIMMPDED